MTAKKIKINFQLPKLTKPNFIPEMWNQEKK